nr:hypothetical protein [Streptomyces polyasparticus]
MPGDWGHRLGPLNPLVEGLVFALVCFAACYVLMAKVLLPRIDAVLHDRDELLSPREGPWLPDGCEPGLPVRLLAEARHDAARTRQRAYEEGAAIIAAARARALEERTELLARGREQIASARAAAEAELRADVDALARELAARILGEPVGAASDQR